MEVIGMINIPSRRGFSVDWKVPFITRSGKRVMKTESFTTTDKGEAQAKLNEIKAEHTDAHIEECIF